MKQLIQRQEYNKKLWFYKDQDLIKVVTGMRRSGKSTLLELFRLQLIDSGVSQNKIQFYNFELPKNYILPSGLEYYHYRNRTERTKIIDISKRQLSKIFTNHRFIYPKLQWNYSQKCI